MPKEEVPRHVLIRDLADLWHRLAELDAGNEVSQVPVADDLRLQGTVEMVRTTGHILGQPMQALALAISSLQHRVPSERPSGATWTI